MDILNSYIDSLYFREDESLLEINFSQVIKRLTPESKFRGWFKDFNSAVKNKKPKEVVNQLKKLGLPKMTIATINKAASTSDSNYMKRKKLAQTILSNSLSKATKKSIEPASAFLAILCAMKTSKNDKRDDMNRLKGYVKEFVLKARKFTDDYGGEPEEKTAKPGGLSKEDLPDVAVAWTIMVMTTGLSVTLSYFIIMNLPSIILLLGIATLVIMALTGIFAAAAGAWAGGRGV